MSSIHTTKRKKHWQREDVQTLVEEESEFFSKRSRIEIMASILEKAKEGSKKTYIMNDCNLSFRQLQKYLKSMRIRELMRKENRGSSIIYKITGKGQKFLKRYSKLALLLGGDAQNCKAVNGFCL